MDGIFCSTDITNGDIIVLPKDVNIFYMPDDTCDDICAMFDDSTEFSFNDDIDFSLDDGKDFIVDDIKFWSCKDELEYICKDDVKYISAFIEDDGISNNEDCKCNVFKDRESKEDS